jgi:hypothetical protein
VLSIVVDVVDPKPILRLKQPAQNKPPPGGLISPRTASISRLQSSIKQTIWLHNFILRPRFQIYITPYHQNARSFARSNGQIRLSHPPSVDSTGSCRDSICTKSIETSRACPAGSLTVECGDAKEASAIKKAVIAHECDAIINAAGVAAVLPWGKSDLPIIVDAVTRAALEVGQERGRPVRLWVLAGMGLLDVPGKKRMLMD